MQRQTSIAFDPQYQRHLRNIRGTFAIEGLSVSEYSQNNLERIATGKATYQQVLQELQAKFKK